MEHHNDGQLFCEWGEQTTQIVAMSVGQAITLALMTSLGEIEAKRTGESPSMEYIQNMVRSAMDRNTRNIQGMMTETGHKVIDIIANHCLAWLSIPLEDNNHEGGNEQQGNGPS